MPLDITSGPVAASSPSGEESWAAPSLKTTWAGDGASLNHGRRNCLVRTLKLTVADSVAWSFALVAAIFLRYELDVAQIAVDSLASIMLITIIAQLMFGGIPLYVRQNLVGSFDDVADVARSMVVVGFLVFIINLSARPQMVPRTVPLIAMPIAILIAAGIRAGVRSVREHAGQKDHVKRRRVILLGAGREARHLVRSMLDSPELGLLPVAMLDDDPRLQRQRFEGIAVEGSRADIAAAAARFDADLLLVAGATSMEVDNAPLAEAAEEAGLQVMLIPPLAEILRLASTAELGAQLDSADDHVARRLTTGCHGKRAVDILLCTLALPIVVPICLVIAAVLVLCQDEVFYRAQRIGRYGREFTMLKFATMRPGEAGPRVTREHDPRITPAGRWLRTTKLNELPQVLNVLKGDMSIVGPRPEDPRYAAFFSTEDRRVLRVRPGMASNAYLEFGDEQDLIECANPADIESYYVHDLLPQKLRIELQYVQNWSILGDLRIIFRTLARLIKSSERIR